MGKMFVELFQGWVGRALALGVGLALWGGADLGAQETGTVRGTVTGTPGSQPLPAAQVYIPQLQLGAVTSGNGTFELRNVPVGEHQVTAELLGRQSETRTVAVQAGETVTVNFSLASRAIDIGGVVVTGVAGATPERELAFTVEQLQVNQAQLASAVNVGSLLQGRMAGTRVIQGTGQPGDEPSIQLRGPTSIMQSQEPLLIIDGVISRGSLADIDPNDIESMEVVRGAAAASLYGSRAQAGVIEVRTRRGAGVESGGTEFTLRTSYLWNDIEYLMRMSLSHEYRMNESGTALLNRNGQEIDLFNRYQQIGSGNYALNDFMGGNEPRRTFQDQTIPAAMFGGSPFEQIMRAGNAQSTYVSASGNEGSTHYRVSARYQRDNGTLLLHDGSSARNVRLNLDQEIGNQFRLSVSSYLADREQDVIFQQETGGLSFLTDVVGDEPMDPTSAPSRGIFRLIDEMRASTDFWARDADGDFEVIGDLISRNLNPLYVLSKQDWTRRTQRVMGAVDARYSPTSSITLEGNFSYDRSNMEETNHTPSPWKRAFPNPPLQGAMFQLDERREEMNYSLTGSYARTIGDLVTRTRVRWLAEDARRVTGTAGGQNFSAVGVPRLGLLTSGLYIDSNEQTIRSEGLFAITALTYKSRYIGDVLVRRDGSSLFGAEERWQNYYRVASAWRMTEESWWPIEALTEFKPRFSVGTAGGRPGFSYQYQTYAVDRGRIVPLVLGNDQLRPERARELEYGLDVIFRDRFRLQANYIDSEVSDQLLLVPQSAALGFQAQWRNAGTVSSKTWEVSMETAFVERPDLVWTGRLNLDRTRQVITELNVPPFEMRDMRARMLVREGEELGAFYGVAWARDCAADLPAGTDCSHFQVNDEGILVFVGQGNDYRQGVSRQLWGTIGTVGGSTYEWGMPIRSIRGDGFTKLGSAQPDLNVSFLQDIQWRNFGFSFLMDAEFGSQIYNQTMQWGSRSATGAIDQRGKPEELKKPLYYYGAGGFYLANARNDRFVEDGDFIKLRELSVRYTVGRASLPSLLQSAGIERATINVVGRNLLTWTDYLGHDPEVGKGTFGGSAAIGRIDEYFYPNFRQFGLDFEIVF
jgi:TonB-linked SusC/RagA family outer membrane protein